MSIYFKDFPTISYDAFRTGNLITCINTTKRFAPIKSVMENATLYYHYTVREGQRPEIVSHLMYDSIDYDWVILAFNMILDPYYEWPLFYQEYNDYIETKYGSIPAASQLIKEYRLITRPYQKFADGSVIEEQSLIIDYNTYLGLPDFQRKKVYAIDYENELNDSRKNIKILDRIYLKQVIEEKQRIFGV